MNIDELLDYDSNNKDNFNDLLDQIDNIVPFVGAGMSAFLYPTWGQFLNDVAQKSDLLLDDDKKQILDLISVNKNEEAADKIEAILGHNFFINKVVHTYAEDKIDARLINQSINKLPLIFQKSVITTNFDRVIEKVYKDCPFVHTVYPGQTCLENMGIQRDTHFLFKIHGDVVFTDSVTFTKDQYENNYGIGDIDMKKPLPSFLASIFKSRQMLFLGCSLEEDRTMKVLDSITCKTTGLRHFAFMQKPTDISEYRRINLMLDRHNIYPIWYPLGNYNCIDVLLDEIVKKK